MAMLLVLNPSLRFEEKWPSLAHVFACLVPSWIAVREGLGAVFLVEVGCHYMSWFEYVWPREWHLLGGVALLEKVCHCGVGL